MLCIAGSVGSVACMGGIRNAYIILARRCEWKGQLGIILKWTYRNRVAEFVLDSFDSGQGLAACSCEY